MGTVSGLAVLLPISTFGYLSRHEFHQTTIHVVGSCTTEHGKALISLPLPNAQKSTVCVATILKIWPFTVPTRGETFLSRLIIP